MAITFEAEVVVGDLRLSDETADFGYFSINALDDLGLMAHHLEKIQDAVGKSPNAIMKQPGQDTEALRNVHREHANGPPILVQFQLVSYLVVPHFGLCKLPLRH